MERTPKKQLGARVYFHRTAVFVLEAVEAGGARGIRTLVWFFPPVAGAGRDFSFDHFKDSSVAVAEKVPCGTQLLYPRRPHQYSRSVCAGLTPHRQKVNKLYLYFCIHFLHKVCLLYPT
ncbi:uncharacterized protein [Panulirus ornatus]|uniref:uncharacterized protein isoform X2 n=1 Tax=Panulirus ornatus TaxID=150431 RepID=UPI003A885E87